MHAKYESYENCILTLSFIIIENLKNVSIYVQANYISCEIPPRSMRMCIL